MRRGSFVGYAFSLAIVGGFTMSAVYAFSGSPFARDRNAAEFKRPAWSSEISSFNGFPAYRLREDGSALAVGRLVALGPDRMRVSLFPDMVAEPIEQSRVVLLQTDARALWALVPTPAKAEIFATVEIMANEVRDRFLAIARSPAFSDRYAPTLRKLMLEAYEKTMDNPARSVARNRVLSIIEEEYTDQMARDLLAIALPRLQRAVLEMVSPTWRNLSDLLTEGRIDTRPMTRAVGDILTDDAFQATVADNVRGILRDDRVWKFGMSTGNAYIEVLTSDPRAEHLLDEVAADPAFRQEMHALEKRAADTMMTVFSRIVGRGADGKPDTLAVRIIRYIMLHRPRLVAVIVGSGQTPPSDLLHRYEPLEIAS